ncbi:signal peptidase 22 kDa subunit [Saitoella complicata NRRL Y-17804]|nr:signal peptidase 22 kDa subunit [Saitoella complicata NRRL Y-17804]ODQ54147.1 signal peptidase 22 kDa subunit [Saitoella complicata NRRL Y-17804]
MYSTSQRISAVFGLFTTVVFTLCAFIAATSWLFTPEPITEVSIRNVNVVKGRTAYQRSDKSQEYALLKFDLDYDLTSLFHWNTKQLFIYLVASYDTPQTTNEVVVWDRIIQQKTQAKRRVRGEKNKYNVNDINGSFKDVNATYSLHWNVMPQVGLLEWASGAPSGVIEFPDAKQR